MDAWVAAWVSCERQPRHNTHSAEFQVLALPLNTETTNNCVFPTRKKVQIAKDLLKQYVRKFVFVHPNISVP